MPKAPPRHSASREKRRKAEFDRTRANSGERGYDSAWYALRNAFIADNPLCCFHLKEGKIVQGEVVDHIIPISQDPSLRLVRSNLRTLCKACHDSHTARTQSFSKSLKLQSKDKV